MLARQIGLGAYTELCAAERGLSLVLASHASTECPAVCSFVETVAAALGGEWLPIHETPHITGGGKAPIDSAGRDRIITRVRLVHPSRDKLV